MSRLSRRRFLAAGAAAAAAPAVVPASALGRAGRPAPSERLTLGVIGVGGMGMSNMNHFLKFPDVQVVGVCDVDAGRKSKSGANTSGRQFAKEAVEKKYSEEMKSGAYKGCEAYADFRELCARKDIQAVVVATPDHWHALTAVEALKNGKDVYGEKPITHLFGEGLILCEAVKKHGRIWQTGSQQRSEWNFRRAVDLVLNGAIGKVKHVEVGLPKGHAKAQGDARPQDPPEGFDYDFWCGPSPKLPYVPARVHFHWRWHTAYGGGQLMDWIGHHNDIAHWGLGMDESGPVEVEAAGFTYSEDRELYDAPVDYEVKCLYANGVTTSISSKNPMGTKWIGADGAWVYVNRGKLDASDKEWLKKEFDPGRIKAYESNDHRRNFLDCVKSRSRPVADVETGHRSTAATIIANIALKRRAMLQWDAKAERFTNDDAANPMLSYEYRSPYTL